MFVECSWFSLKQMVNWTKADLLGQRYISFSGPQYILKFLWFSDFGWLPVAKKHRCGWKMISSRFNYGHFGRIPLPGAKNCPIKCFPSFANKIVMVTEPVVTMALNMWCLSTMTGIGDIYKVTCCQGLYCGDAWISIAPCKMQVACVFHATCLVANSISDFKWFVVQRQNLGK